jgi:D-aminopeptidase
LVQTNFGGILSIAGVPVAKELGNHYLINYLQQNKGAANRMPGPQTADGSIMVVVATDAPIDHRNLNRLAARAMLGPARTGSSESNGSGDYVIAFSAAPGVRIQADSAMYQPKVLLTNGSMSPLFEAVIEATEEAIYNSMFRAHDMAGNGHTVKALPLEETIELLKKHSAISAK